MLVGHPPRPAGLAGVRAPPGGQPDLELGRLHLRADADRQPAAQSPSRQSASALVADLVGGSGDTHLSPCVRDAHRGAHDGHHRKARGLKRAEQHAAPSGRIDRVQPHIGLVEGAEVRQRQCGAHRGMPHRERDQPHVCDTVEDVGPGARRVEMFDGLRAHRPVHEGQVGPELAERHRTRKVRRGDREPGQ